MRRPADSSFLVSKLLLWAAPDSATFATSSRDQEIRQLLNPVMVFATSSFLAHQFHLMERTTASSLKQFLHLAFLVSLKPNWTLSPKVFCWFLLISPSFYCWNTFVLLSACIHSLDNLVTFYGLKYSQDFQIYVYNLDSTPLCPSQVPSLISKHLFTISAISHVSSLSPTKYLFLSGSSYLSKR